MVLSDWLEGLDYELLQGSLEVQVSDVSYDSRKAKEGDVFVCMTGTRVDSHLFIPQVEEAGVRVIVIERPLKELLKAVSPQVTVLRVKDGRRALALLSAARFGYPARKMITVGEIGRAHV